MAMFGCLMLILPVLCWVWYHFRYRCLIAAAAKLPLLQPSWPLLGNLHWFFNGYEGFSTTMFKKLKEIGARPYKNATLWWGPVPFIVVGELEDIQMVLTSKLCAKSEMYNETRCLFGNGLLTAPDFIHKITRPHMRALFTPRNMDNYLPYLDMAAQNLVHDLYGLVGKGLQNIQPLVEVAMFKSAFGLILGPADLDNDREELKRIINRSHRIAFMVIKRMTTPHLKFDTIYNLLYRKINDECLKVIRGFFNKYLKEIRNNGGRDDTSTNGTDDTVFNVKERPTYTTFTDVYERIRENHPQFTDQYKLDEIITLVGAGSHTSENLLCAVLLNLAATPHIQERLYQDVVSVVGRGQGGITREQLNNMHYLDMVYKEGLRKCAPIPVVVRQAKADINLGEILVPAGTNMLVSMVTQNYNSDIFVEPHKFEPKRFSPNNLTQEQKRAFTPYALGPRDCIGMQYAALNMKLLLAHVIRSYRLTTTVDVDNLTYNWTFVMAPVDGYRVVLHSR